jgi:2-keto-4-pentenoate hydratase/2-oxohepta-3-ene-1,7-dioic acid hydratase in catechol pathway
MGMEARLAFFVKAPGSVVGHMHPILVSEGMKADYEGEIAVVVGARLRHASPREARGAVAAFLAANDVTERRLQEEMSWSIAKSLDTFGPLGPVAAVTTDPGELEELCVETRLNGEVVQPGCASEMVASIPEILARLSQLATLRPGDVVITGTPPGVGHSRSPLRYLRPGDLVEVEVTGLPALANPVERARGRGEG